MRRVFLEYRFSQIAHTNEIIPEKIRNIDCVNPTTPTSKDKPWVISITRGPNTDTDAHSEIVIKKITKKVNLIFMVRSNYFRSI
jgi:hypothetical protein